MALPRAGTFRRPRLAVALEHTLIVGGFALDVLEGIGRVRRRFAELREGSQRAVDEGFGAAKDVAASSQDDYRLVRGDVEYVRADLHQEARAQSEALAEALDELLIGGADAVSMEYAKRAAKVVLRSYRKARDAT